MDIQIVLTYREDFFGKLARKWGLATWTHAALRTRSSATYPWKVYEAAAKGIVSRDWYDFIRGCEEYSILELYKDYELSYLGKAQLQAYADGNVGKFYQYLKLVRIAIELLLRLRKPPTVAAGYVCSTFVVDCFKYVGRSLVDYYVEYELPDDIYASPLLIEVERHYPLTI